MRKASKLACLDDRLFTLLTVAGRLVSGNFSGLSLMY